MPNTTLGPYLVFNRFLTRAQSVSLALHGGLIAFLLIPALAPPPDALKPRDTWLVFPGLRDVTEWKAEAGKGDKNRGGGGGGQREKDPARYGGIPPFMKVQLTPPGRPQRDARLLVPESLAGPDLRLPSRILIGDPDSKSLLDSLGRGSRGGIGDGDRGGVGPGKGPGLGEGEGGWTGGPGRIEYPGKKGVSTPVCSYCPNPTFTDEAIHAKGTGAVLLQLIVTAEGLPTNISVIRSVGYGLDERARHAVRDWRFTPARDASGRPVATWVKIEVHFHQF